MKRSSTLFLKAVILLVGIGVLTAMIWFPQTEGRAANLELISIYKDPFIIYLFIVSIPFFTALYQAFKLLNYIDNKKIFSQPAVKTVGTIKYCAITFVGLLVVAIAYVSLISKVTHDDGAGAIAVGLVTIFASIVISAAAGLFEKLLQNAVDMNKENDLTV